MQTKDLWQGRYVLQQRKGKAWIAQDTINQIPYVLKAKADFNNLEVITWLKRSWFPGIPRIQDEFVENDGTRWYAFEYMPGYALCECIATVDAKDRLNVIERWFAQAARLLTYLQEQSHRALVHLDIKPEHLILGPDDQVALIDFGAAILYEKTSSDGLPANSLRPKTKAENRSSLFMTPEFAAPEQFKGEFSLASDQYSLALTMLSLLTGKKPSVCRNADSKYLLRTLPDPVRETFATCLSIHPSQRFSNASDLLQSLATWSTDSTNLAPCLSVEAVSGVSKTQENSNGSVSSIWGNPQFACEMAVQLSRTHSVLLIETDWFDPRTELLLGLQASPGTFETSSPAGGLDQALGLASRKEMNLDLMRDLTESVGDGKLRVLRPEHDLHRFERYSQESFWEIVTMAKAMFDQVLLLCNTFIYDAFTCLSLLSSDRILIALQGSFVEFRSFGRAISFLQGKGILQKEKIRFIAFDHQPQNDLSPESMKAWVKDRWVGVITYSRQRRRQGSQKRSYALHLNNQNRQEYQAIIRKLFRVDLRQPNDWKRRLSRSVQGKHDTDKEDEPAMDQIY